MGMNAADPDMAGAQLKRRIGPGLLTAYGVGVMLGAGIYVLVGAVAGAAGIWAPLSFFLAGLVAAPSALSYAELSTRYPESAGEAAYVEAAFNRRWLMLAVGLAVALAGAISAGAVLVGGAGYLGVLIDMPGWVAVLLLGIPMIIIALIGVLESLRIAAILTGFEVMGLVLVIWAGGMATVLSPDWIAAPPPVWGGVALGATLAFFAFIGFEDIVNMAEEVRNPPRDLPIAIIASLLITTALYGLVAWAALRSVPVAALAASNQPLALVWESATGRSAGILSLIAVVAALNGVLGLMIMSTRVLFGLGRRGGVLAVFHAAHPRFGTPVLATLVVGAAIIIAALTLPLAALAELTSMILLVVFALINAALIVLRARGGPRADFQVWGVVPWFGLLGSIAAFVAALVQ